MIVPISSIDLIALDIPPNFLLFCGEGMYRAIGPMRSMGTMKGRKLWLTC